MMGRMFGNVLGAAILAMFIITPLIYLLSNNGTITIERPYRTEWAGCESKLFEEVKKNTPSCAPCECKQSEGYYVFYVLGLLVYLGSLFFMKRNKDKLDKRKEELDEREERFKLAMEVNRLNNKTRRKK